MIIAPTIRVRVKGGPGSGNWGHRGRPGMVGGSGGRGSIGSAIRFSNDVKSRFGIDAQVLFQDKIVVTSMIEPSGSIEVDGFYDPYTKVVRVRSGLLQSDDNIDAIGFDRQTTAAMGGSAVVAHELMHVLDGGYDRVYSRSKEFDAIFMHAKQKLLDGDKDGVVSRYAMTSATEFFAENGAVYMLNPNWLEAHAPEVFHYYNSM